MIRFVERIISRFRKPKGTGQWSPEEIQAFDSMIANMRETQVALRSAIKKGAEQSTSQTRSGTEDKTVNHG